MRRILEVWRPPYSEGTLSLGRTICSRAASLFGAQKSPQKHSPMKHLCRAMLLPADARKSFLKVQDKTAPLSAGLFHAFRSSPNLARDDCTTRKILIRAPQKGWDLVGPHISSCGWCEVCRSAPGLMGCMR